METLDHRHTLVMIPQGSPKQMFTDDEVFWSAGCRICSAWFVENVVDWAKKVDEQAVTEYGMMCEEWESMVSVLLESVTIGDAWRLLKPDGVKISKRMAEYLSSPIDENDPTTGFSSNGEPVREWFRRITPQTCDGSFSSSVISVINIIKLFWNWLRAT